MAGSWEIQPPKTDLLLGMIHTGVVTWDWALEYGHLLKVGRTIEQGWRGLPFDVGRNRLVKDARANGARHIFMLDTDCIAQRPNAIHELLSLNLPIVSGLYWSKQGCPGCWGWVADQRKYSPYQEIPPSTLMEVDAVGAGCLLIDMRVFDVLDQMGIPWFQWTIHDPLNQNDCYSEDFNFCQNAKKAGFHIYVHTGIQFYHEETIAWNMHGQRTLTHGM